MSWLSDAEKFNVELRRTNELESSVRHPETEREKMARVIRELAASGPLLRNIYTSMFMSESRNEGLPPQVQYWLQEITKFLDNLSPDAKALVVPIPED